MMPAWDVKRLSQIAARSRGKPLFKSVQIPYNIEEIGQEKVGKRGNGHALAGTYFTGTVADGDCSVQSAHRDASDCHIT